jgi:hypothetical protein
MLARTYWSEVVETARDKGAFGSILCFPGQTPSGQALSMYNVLFGCVHIQSQAKESRRLVAWTR